MIIIIIIIIIIIFICSPLHPLRAEAVSSDSDGSIYGVTNTPF